MRDPWPAPRRGSLILLVLSVVWLAGMIWAADANLLERGDSIYALAAATSALPVVIAATMLAGGAAGLTAVVWRPIRPRLHWPLAIGTGTLVGAVAAGLIIMGYGQRSSIVVIAVAVLVAGTIGGVIGAVPFGAVVHAGLTGALAAFVADSVFTYFDSLIMPLFGPGHTAASRLAAASRFALTTSLLAGLIAGSLAFWLLYRARCGWRFQAYLGAGASAGALLLLTEAITRVGGAEAFRSVASLSPADRVYVDYVAQSRLDHGLIVFFVGGIVALLCFGSTLKKPEPSTRARSAR
jgi:hypothetical protein